MIDCCSLFALQVHPVLMVIGLVLLNGEGKYCFHGLNCLGLKMGYMFDKVLCVVYIGLEVNFEFWNWVM